MNKQEFVKYFFEFYGPNGLYPIAGLTVREVKAGIQMRGKQFEGDSFDREAIRDMVLIAQNKMGGVFEIGTRAK